MTTFWRGVVAISLLMTSIQGASAQTGETGEDGQGEAVYSEELDSTIDPLAYVSLDVAQSAPTRVISDGDFSSGWIDLSWIGDDPFYPGPGPGVSASNGSTRIGSGGNPGAYRATTHTVFYGDLIYSASINNTAVITPSLGAITALGLQLDSYMPRCCTIGISLVLEQDGVLYESTPLGQVVSTVWKPVSGVFLPSDFTVALRSGSSTAPVTRTQPVFDTTGGPIRLGYMLGQRLGGSPGQSVTSVVNVDNWRVTVNPSIAGVITGLEVTQGVQDPRNSVDLVGNRLTVARVYLSNPTPMALPEVRLYGIDINGDELPGSPLSPSMPYAKVPTTSSRNLLESSANFVLPFSWSRPGARNIYWVEINNEVPTLCRLRSVSADASCGVRITYGAAHDLNLAVQPLNWYLVPSRRTGAAPTTPSMQAAIDRIYQLLPISSINLTWLPEERIDLIEPDACALELLDPDFKIACQAFAYQAHNQHLSTQAAMLEEPYAALALIESGGAPLMGGLATDRAATATTFGYNPAHEIGHTFSLAHAPCGGASGPDPRFPNPDGRISLTLLESDPATQYGIRINDLYSPQAVILPWAPDLMSYCFQDPPGISGYHREKAATFLTGRAFDTFNVAGDGVQFTQPSGSLVVSGVITPATNTAVISTVVHSLVQTSRPPDTLDMPYRLRVHQAGQGSFWDYGIDLGQARDPDLGKYGFTIRIPYYEDYDRLWIATGQTELADITPSANPPTVTVTAPTGGALSGPTTVRWIGSDPDGDPLTYVLWYRPSTRVNWTYVAGPTTQTEIVVNPATLPGGESGQFMVEVGDNGLRFARSETAANHSIPNKPPVVEIVSPEPGLTFSLTDRITVNGIGRDLEGGMLRSGEMRWLVGTTVLSTMASAVIDGSTLGVGTHALTLEGRDSRGAIGVTTVPITIVDGPRVPISQLLVSPTSLPIFVQVGSRADGHVAVFNPGLGEQAYQATSSAPWLLLSAQRNSTAVPLTLIANAATLPLGVYTATVTIQADNAALPSARQTVQVSMHVVKATVYLPLIRRGR